MRCAASGPAWCDGGREGHRECEGARDEKPREVPARGSPRTPFPGSLIRARASFMPGGRERGGFQLETAKISCRQALRFSWRDLSPQDGCAGENLFIFREKLRSHGLLVRSLGSGVDSGAAFVEPRQSAPRPRSTHAPHPRLVRAARSHNISELQT